jgi:hypothetical protein
VENEGKQKQIFQAVFVMQNTRGAKKILCKKKRVGRRDNS